MRIWDKKKSFAIIFIFTLIFSFGFSSNNITPYHAKMQPTELRSPLLPSISENFEEETRFLKRFKTSENETFDFSTLYSYLNPQLVTNLTGNNITIAILDSGINMTPWIKPSNLISNYTTITNSSIVVDDNGHGTAVASIIGKVAPDARLISIKVTDKTGTAKREWVEAGFRLAQSLNVTIIHASLGSRDLRSFNATILRELTYRNISTIISAGNEGPYGSTITSPAIFADSIAVGIAYNQSLVPFISSAGPRPNGLLGPDIVAPGINIPTYIDDNQQIRRSGSSFAASFVTGAIALLKEAYPNVTSTTLKAALLESATFMNETSPIHQGNGFLDISKAYQQLENLEKEHLFVFSPKKLSSEFVYFGHSVNGDNRKYQVSLYSTTESNITFINTSQIKPIEASIGNLPLKIEKGFNILNVSLAIPNNLKMDNWEGNITFEFDYGETRYKNISASIKNRYQGGNVLFYQGYDNDSFNPSGPTGSFSLLQKFLEGYYGMNIKGAVRPNELLAHAGPLIPTSQTSGKITSEDLENQDILVLSDIEFGITENEIQLIRDWVDDGHSLLILSYPSHLDGEFETLSNQTAINDLLKPYGISIANDTPSFSRFNQANVTISDPIFEESIENLPFDYNGTSLSILPDSDAKIIAVAEDKKEEEELPVACYWENPESGGKVIVFGSETPFTDPSLLSENNIQNLLVITRIFRWMIRGQQEPLELIFTSPPTIGSATQLQITIDYPSFTATGFKGTIVEANGSYSQLNFTRSINTYLSSSWQPLAAGDAILWLDLEIPGKARTNGLFIIKVADTLESGFNFIFLIGILIILGLGFWFYSTRRPQIRSPIEESVALAMRRRKKTPQHPGLDTFEVCPRCQTPRFMKDSKYCYKCGREL
ncbi:MAG: S8 family serine peptidase [Candidatus Hodarchaeota archaeon]